MYSYYLHGIEETHQDIINRERISNFDRCNEENRQEQLSRTTRISLTIRNVEKTTKLPMGIFKK